MKLCPFCAEEIKEEAIKCRYCGEWLKDKQAALDTSSESENRPPVSPVGLNGYADSSENTPEPNAPPHHDTRLDAIANQISYDNQSIKETKHRTPTTDLYSTNAIPQKAESSKRTKPFVYALLLGTSAICVDALFGVFVSFLTTAPDEWFLRALLYSMYVSLGLVFAGFFYKLRNMVLTAAISIVVLLVLRIALLLVAANTSLGSYVKMELDSTAFATAGVNTLIEIGFIYLPLLGWAWLLKRTEPKLKFTTVSNIRRDLKDSEGPGSKWKYDEGTCGQCGKTTVIAVERSIKFFGKGERYFCEHCRTFIGGNPLKAAVDGFAAAVISFVFLCGFALSSQPGRSSTAWSFVGFMFILGVFGGLRKVGESGYALFKSYR